jgi:hypothetical protein
MRAFLLALLLVSPLAATAHEHLHTHAGLTDAALELLDSPYLTEDARFLIRQGSIDEDQCPRYFSHFYNPRTGRNTILDGRDSDPNCGEGDADSDFPPGQMNAAERAEALWQEALAQHAAGNEYYAGSDACDGTGFCIPVQVPAAEEGSYHLLGRALHLLEDMTSPAHAHNDPHGKLLPSCGQDADDFEVWGWCDNPPPGFDPTSGIRAYVNAEGRIERLLDDQIRDLFGGRPRFASGRSGHSYVHDVALQVYEFTTFDGHLRAGFFQPDSELIRMFPGIGWDGFPNVGILDFTLSDGEVTVGKSIGFLIGAGDPGQSFNNCGRSEGLADLLEQWWPMENPDGETEGPVCEVFTEFPDPATQIRAEFYIENSGGGIGLVPAAGGLTPRVYEKDLYRTDDNNKELLRIYGDTMYPLAVVYAAGLIQTFIEEAIGPPVAESGGAYRATLCMPQTFDAGDSFDRNGEIVLYEWDIDGVEGFEVVSTSPRHVATFVEELERNIRLRVTDDDGLTDVDVSELLVAAPLGAVLGSGGNDKLRGTDRADILIGLGGNDTLIGGAGDDLLLGCDGKDVLRGDDGHDVVHGGPDNDRLKGGKGNDVVGGGDGDDQLAGDHGDDVLDGGEGDDRLKGGKGDDVLDGGRGKDRLKGNAGFDRCGQARSIGGCEAGLVEPALAADR